MPTEEEAGGPGGDVEDEKHKTGPLPQGACNLIGERKQHTHENQLICVTFSLESFSRPEEEPSIFKKN